MKMALKNILNQTSDSAITLLYYVQFHAIFDPV